MALQQPLQRKLRVAVPCPGVGRIARGYERFAIDLTRALAGLAEVRLFGSAIPPGLPGARVPSLSRQWLEHLGDNPGRAYYREQVSFSAGLAARLVRFRPDIIHVSDPALANVLVRLRRVLPGKPHLVFCNGAPLSVEHYRRYEHVQLVQPGQVDESGRAGIPREQVTLLPLGFDPAVVVARRPAEAVRSELRLPTSRLAISVAALDAGHKRLDYLIAEFARPELSDWTLLLLGARTHETPMLEGLAQRLAPKRVLFRTVAPDAVFDYVNAADLFLLASKGEGFGLALLEAMALGKPVLVRDLPALRFLTGDVEQVAPLDASGELASLISALTPDLLAARGARNRSRAHAEFSWPRLAPRYLAMYERIVAEQAA